MNVKRKTLFAIIVGLVCVGTGAAFFAFSKGTNKPSWKAADQVRCNDCNIVLITMTNLRYDHMSQNGYPRPTTPNLDKLAEESLVFDNAFSHASWTLPEGIAIYTGLYPFQHGVMNRYDGSTLSKNTPTLIDVLNQNGYKTAVFTGGFDYNPKFGLTSRFSTYDECTKGDVSRVQSIRVSGPNLYGELGCTVPKAIAWLKENSHQKFFLHVQGYDAHCPFSQRGGDMYDKEYEGSVDYSTCLWTFERTEPVTKDGQKYYKVYSSKSGGKDSVLLSENDVKHLAALYDESITVADGFVGMVLDEITRMGLADSTIIIFTSEHGDLFGEHGRFMRGGPIRGTFYDAVLHVPLLIKHPTEAPKKVAGLVGHIDLPPTILDILELEPLSGIQGKSIVPLITENKSINPFIFSGSEFTPDPNNIYFYQRTRAETVRTPEWRLVKETVFSQNPPLVFTELYDMLNGKDESTDVSKTETKVFNRLHALLEDVSERIRSK